MINRVGLLIILICAVQLSFSQTGDNDYYLGHGFNNGDTVYTNSGTFWDAGGLDDYGTNEQWTVWFCSNNGNPLTFDFSDFATDYRGTLPDPGSEFRDYDYLTIYYGGDSAHAYHDDTPQFSFTSPDGCVGFRFRSQPSSLRHNGWEAEISANPPPSNNEPCTAAALIAGNVCAPSVFNNKGAYGTGIGSPACHEFLGGDVWFTAEVPLSGQLKVETFAGTLNWAVMVIYSGGDCNSLTELFCDHTTSAMPTRILTGRAPGETIYIRVFGDQAKSGTFGICASDPTAPIEGFTGPGGVGNADENDLWLRADKGALNSGGTEAFPSQSVQNWNDQSGNENNVTQLAVLNQPLLAGDAINGQPVLTFNGTSQHMTGEMGPISAPITLISVSRFAASPADGYVMTVGNLNDNLTVSVSRETDNNYYAFTQGAKYYGPPMSDNTPYIIHARHNSASTFHEFFLNETASAAAEYGTGVVTDGSLIMGANRNINTFFEGDIAEAIVYNYILNSAQKIIVENYLAAKYGIALLTTDRYAHQAVHGYDVAGIGQVDAGNQHTHAQSARILAIGNPTDLNDGEFLLFGHDNGDISAWISTDLPDNDVNLLRVEREWRVNATGGDGIGNVTVSLFDTIMPAFPPEFLSFILWVDEDGDFTTGAIPYPVVRVGNQYIANSVNLPDGYYMTVGCVRPVAGFSLPASAGLESVANPQIEVSLNYGVSMELTVQYRAIDGTASGGGIDYLLNPDALTFLPGTKTAYIVPLINDNDIAETDKAFEIRISSPSLGLMLGTDSIHTYTILNDDIGVTALTDTDSIGSCYPAVANLDVNIVGTGPYTFAWAPTDSLSDPGIADPIANPSLSTWYVVEVTDQSNGATGTDSIFITVLTAPEQPVITAGGPATFCSGDSVDLTSSPAASYLWSNGETTRTIRVRSNGNFSVQVRDTSGCQSIPSATTTVTVYNLPPTPSISVNGSTDVCENDSVILTSSPGIAYLWSTGDTNQSIAAKTTGDFTVQTINGVGCLSLPSDPVTINIRPGPGQPAITGNDQYCTGDSAMLSGSPAAAYQWSTGDTTSTIYVASGSYTLTVSDAYGCSSPVSDPFTVNEWPKPPRPVITPSGPIQLESGDSVILVSSSCNKLFLVPGRRDHSLHHGMDSRQL